MHTLNNTILITGGGSGIGRALAESFLARGNRVIIAGRRQAALDEVTRANPGMASLPLDIEDPAAIRDFAAKLVARHPTLNVVVHNAGIMRLEDLAAAPDYLADAEATIATNVLGPIRLTAAFLPHLRKQASAAIITVTSGLAFIPLAGFPTYCASKAAMHSYTESLRFQLRNTKVEVIELAPPYVQTELTGAHQATDPRAMPLKSFIAESMALLSATPTPPEILVENVKPLRFAARGDYAAFYQNFNEAMVTTPH
ncbi:MAG TPA: SDR family oxidoreductase [Candidatus Didemnitutus sp.]|nr:SDR family oxidoreductase [Candidatus Didemnitutus sp.]